MDKHVNAAIAWAVVALVLGAGWYWMPRDYLPLERTPFFSILFAVATVWIAGQALWDANESDTPNPARWSFVDVAREAQKQFGWLINHKTAMHLLDLVEGLTEAARAGRVAVYGRETADGDLTAIPKDHWEVHRIDGVAAAWMSDNKRAASELTEDPTQKGYSDLHFDRWQVLRWLMKEGEVVKGRNEKDLKKQTESAEDAKKEPEKSEKEDANTEAAETDKTDAPTSDEQDVAAQGAAEEKTEKAPEKPSEPVPQPAKPQEGTVDVHAPEAVRVTISDDGKPGEKRAVAVATAIISS